MPPHDATAMDVARIVLPNGTEDDVRAAACAIGLFAANCVWQAILEAEPRFIAAGRRAAMAEVAAEAEREALLRAGLVMAKRGPDAALEYGAQAALERMAAWAEERSR